MEEQTAERVVTVLSDHNIEGQASVLWELLKAGGWLDGVSANFARFVDVGLAHETTDRAVWRFAQAHRMLLLTDNRKMKSKDSLQRTILEENHAGALPVVTIARKHRLDEAAYRERCALRLVEIIIDVESYRGSGRLFIP
jgi:hypothetical protein